MRKSIVCVVGTRPEAIKMAPVIRSLQNEPWADCRVLVTGQHRELLDSMLEFFEINPHFDLQVMRAGQSLTELLARLLVGLREQFVANRPDMVVAQGDTTTVLAAALAAFGERIPFAHVEAGLRTHDLNSPFPEEGNRVLAARLAQLHFAPTRGSRDNLLREGISSESIINVGNTVIDALLWAADRKSPIEAPLNPRRRLVLVTAHRRDCFGAGLENICQAVSEICETFDDVEVLWPVHPNPSIGPVVRNALGGHPNIHLCEPLSYGSFATAMNSAYLILTDSGGVQEEAPALGKPVLVMRESSERPEAIDAGVAKLVGTDRAQIVAAASRLLSDAAEYSRMSRGACPYGDGRAAERIVGVVAQYLGVVARSTPINEFTPQFTGSAA